MKKKSIKSIPPCPPDVFVIECVDSGHIADVAFVCYDKAVEVCRSIQSNSKLNVWRVRRLFVSLDKPSYE